MSSDWDRRNKNSSLEIASAWFSSAFSFEICAWNAAWTSVLAKVSKSLCIVNAADQARLVYDQLIDMTIDEVDGKLLNKSPEVFDLTRLSEKCPKEDICSAHGKLSLFVDEKLCDDF